MGAFGHFSYYIIETFHSNPGIQCAAKWLLERDQSVLAVEEQHREHLVRLAAEMQLHECATACGWSKQRLPGSLRQRAARHLDHCQQLGALGRAQARRPERVRTAVRNRPRTAEAVEPVPAPARARFALDTRCAAAARAARRRSAPRVRAREQLLARAHRLAGPSGECDAAHLPTLLSYNRGLRPDPYLALLVVPQRVCPLIFASAVHRLKSNPSGSLTLHYRLGSGRARLHQHLRGPARHAQPGSGELARDRGAPGRPEEGTHPFELAPGEASASASPRWCNGSRASCSR